MTLHHRRNVRRGNIVVLTAFLMIGLLAMLAFALDMGYIVLARTELQRTADAAALDAVQFLPDKQEARSIAQAAAIVNVGAVAPPLNSSDVHFGIWDYDTAQFVYPEPPLSNANAVRVTLKMTQANGNPLPLFLGPLLGTDNVDVAASAIATYDRHLCGPLVGIEWVSVPGNPSTDSYNSDYGPYDAATAGERGGVCSDGPVSVEGDAIIRGDARAGKGFSVAVEGNAEVTGNIGTRLKPLNMPAVDASVAESDNDNISLPLILKGNNYESPIDNQGNFVLDGTKVYDMPAGTYYFNDFTLSGQAVLNITDQVIIFVTGDLYRGGGVMVNNNSQLPSNLQIYMTGGSAELTSENDFYGVIYGPNTDIRLAGSADWYGGTVGKTLTFTGSGSAHYDEALKMEHASFPLRVTLVE